MDPLFLVGLLLALLSIVVSTVMDGNSFGPLVGPSSAVLVFFGAVGAAMMAYRKADLGSLPKALATALKSSPPDLSSTIVSLADIADTARREGMLALEGKLEDITDPFLRMGTQLMVDGVDHEQSREVLEIHIAAVDQRHKATIGFFKALGTYAPTFGMVGTVIGLINMLGNLSDPSQLGAGMSVALLTTLYGVLFANLLFLPVAARLERLNSLELSALDVALDGLQEIQSGISPRQLVERLETYLPPVERVGYAARVKGESPAVPVADAGEAA